IGAAKLGVDLAVATPKGYEIPIEMKELIQQSGSDARIQGKLTETNVPEEAIKDADLLVTDTWISMGQEEEKAKRIKAFDGFQITPQLAEMGGAKPGWKFMHCLPRHPEEVSDEVFYSPRSLVFPEAENRLWAAIAVLEGFLVNREKAGNQPKGIDYAVIESRALHRDLCNKLCQKQIWSEVCLQPNLARQRSDQRSKAPEDGFLFKNKDTPAAAVVAKKINGKITPYYISPVLLPPGGRLGDSKLIPTPTVAVWCQMDVDNGTMIESDKSDLYIIKLQGTTAKATFNEDGYGALARTR
ncbi:MAG: hypothetical protein L6R42_007726, partial [Xanthoria sp. 1 TBL-2021]